MAFETRLQDKDERITSEFPKISRCVAFHRKVIAAVVTQAAVIKVVTLQGRSVALLGSSRFRGEALRYQGRHVSGEKPCVTTLTTAAKGTIAKDDC